MSLLSKLFGLGKARAPAESSPLDYDQMVLLDAEDLAEQGIVKAYEKLQPRLREYVENPEPLTERDDPETCSYFVTYGGQERTVYSPDLPGSEENSWGRATCIFFEFVNSQLQNAPVRFYAINGGNDLGGMFLTDDAARDARSKLGNNDWPYLPDLNDPDFGQFAE